MSGHSRQCVEIEIPNTLVLARTVSLPLEVNTSNKDSLEVRGEGRQTNSLVSSRQYKGAAAS